MQLFLTALAYSHSEERGSAPVGIRLILLQGGGEESAAGGRQGTAER